MSISPTQNKVLIRKIQGEKKQGNILLPEGVMKENLEVGVVQAVGPGIVDPITGKFREVAVNVGDTVLFETHTGSRIPMGIMDNNENLILISEAYIAAIVTPKE